VEWFNVSLVGWIILIIAVAIAAHLLGAPTVWIAVGTLFLIGIGVIVSASTHSRKRL
jgi:hypothetical protein